MWKNYAAMDNYTSIYTISHSFIYNLQKNFSKAFKILSYFLKIFKNFTQIFLKTNVLVFVKRSHFVSIELQPRRHNLHKIWSHMRLLWALYFRNSRSITNLKMECEKPHFEKIAHKNLLTFLQPKIIYVSKSSFFSRLQTTRETVTNTFCGYLARKNYAVRELPTHVSQFVLFSLKYIFSRENSFDFVILSLLARKSSKHRDMRNLSRKVIPATWINLYTRFLPHMFSCREHILRTFRESSVAGFWQGTFARERNMPSNYDERRIKVLAVFHNRSKSENQNFLTDTSKKALAFQDRQSETFSQTLAWIVFQHFLFWP